MKKSGPLLLLLSLVLLSGFLLFGCVDLNAPINEVPTGNGMEVVIYYGQGCPHCARLEERLDEVASETGSIYVVKKEVYFNSVNNKEMQELMDYFGLDMNLRGVPFTLIDNRSAISGEVSKERLEEIITEHFRNESISGIYTELSFTPRNGVSPATHLTLAMLIGAAAVDAINPCTITVMVLLLGVILMSEGKRKMALAAATFIIVVFIAYLLMGVGILTAIQHSGLTSLFYQIVTVAAFLLAMMEFNAYFRYKPGFFAVEMPMFLRPYTKKVMKKATSIPGVAFAALMCSLFLLPCSSGPYLMVLGMLANAVTLKALFYLVLYNIIFVVPMVVIAAAVYMGRTTVEEIGDMRERYIRQIHLISGLILFALFLIMLSQIIGFGA